MWLVLASDLMFFLGLVGAFIVLRAGNAHLFADHVKGLNKGLAGAGVLALSLSSVMMFIAVRAARLRLMRRCCIALVATLLCGGSFAAVRLIEYSNALNHHTMVARQTDGDPLVVFDGQIDWWNGEPKNTRIIDGYAAPDPSDFDPHTISEEDIAALSPEGARSAKEFTLPAEVFQDIPYGPGKNIFYANWFTLTGAHLFHVGAGMLAITFLLIQNLRKKLPLIQAECVGLFWHFTVMVGIVLFPLIYLG